MHLQVIAELALAGMALSQAVVSPEDSTGVGLLPVANSSSFQPLDHALKVRNIEIDQLEERNLEKRDAKPWIGSHFLAGCATTGDVLPKQMHGMPSSYNKYMAGDRPALVKGNCQSFAPQTEYIGISWGAGAFEANTLKVFQKSDCSGPVVTTIVRKGAEAGACFTRMESPGMSAVIVMGSTAIVH